MATDRILIAIVDDHTLFRKTLKNFLSEQQNLSVVIQAPDISELLYKLKICTIDVLLMDIFMPQSNAMDALKVIRAEYSNIKILIVSMCVDMELISDLLEAGVHGYISKGDEPEELLQAIETVAHNRIYRNRIFTEALYWNRQNNMQLPAEKRNVHLNERERRLLELIWQEKSNKEIADELFLGVRSVEKIRQDMKEKIGVRSTVGLLKYAISQKIIGNSHKSQGMMQ